MHNNWDRDEYVTIHMENVKAEFKDQFEKNPTIFGRLPYDYKSIMHYGKFFYSMNFLPTIIPKVSI